MKYSFTKRQVEIFLLINFLIIFSEISAINFRKANIKLDFLTKYNTEKINTTNNKSNNFNSTKDLFSNDLDNDLSNFDAFKNYVLNFVRGNSLPDSDSNSLNYNKKPQIRQIKDFYKNKKSAVTKMCSKSNCNYPNGVCVSATECRCNFEYINTQDSSKLCDYKVSYQLIALILEALFPIGTGHFYCKRLLIGIMKLLVLFIIPILLLCLFRNIFFKKQEGHCRRIIIGKKPKIEYTEIVKNVSLIFYMVIFIVWYFFDFIIFSMNKHKDGSGIDLIPIDIRY